MAHLPQLPETHRVLQLISTEEPLQVQTLPTPQPGSGSAVVQVLAATVVSYAGDVYNGKRRFPFPKPLVPGSSAIGRVAAVGPDATILTPGQLVFLDCTIRGRDDPSAAILSGIAEGFTEGSRKLMHGEWRNSTYAEYTKFPLENCFPLNEQRLLGSPSSGGLGYSVEHLCQLTRHLIPYGGLDDINFRPGETLIVAPATGQFGSGAVRVALAMGASRVIAMGRNEEVLRELSALSDRVATVKITGDEQADAEALKSFGPVDVFFDISPPMAAGSTHFKSAIAALRHSGRVSLMGGVQADVSFPYFDFMRRSLLMKGTWMYSRTQILNLIKWVESGLLPFGEEAGLTVKGKFGLEEWREAFEAASACGNDETVVIVP